MLVVGHYHENVQFHGREVGRVTVPRFVGSRRPIRSSSSSGRARDRHRIRECTDAGHRREHHGEGGDPAFVVEIEDVDSLDLLLSERQRNVTACIDASVKESPGGNRQGRACSWISSLRVCGPYRVSRRVPSGRPRAALAEEARGALPRPSTSAVTQGQVRWKFCVTLVPATILTAAVAGVQPPYEASTLYVPAGRPATE